MVFAYTIASYHCQIANPVGTSRYYVRGANGATWSAWQKLVTQDNINGFYNANTDRNVEANRINAMKHILDNGYQGNCTIRYASGYYYGYSIPYGAAESKILEMTYNGATLWTYNNATQTMTKIKDF